MQLGERSRKITRRGCRISAKSSKHPFICRCEGQRMLSRNGTPQRFDDHRILALNLRPELTQAVSELGYSEPTPSSPLSSRSCADRGRHHRPGADRHRLDRRLRHSRFEQPDAARNTFRRWCCVPRELACRSRGHRRVRPVARCMPSWRSMAASPTALDHPA